MQIFLSCYSMGAWDGWNLMQANPNLFAGAIMSAGGAALSTSEWQAVGSNNVLNFVGELDREELRNNVAVNQKTWVRFPARRMLADE